MKTVQTNCCGLDINHCNYPISMISLETHLRSSDVVCQLIVVDKNLVETITDISNTLNELGIVRGWDMFYTKESVMFIVTLWDVAVLEEYGQEDYSW